LRKKQISSQAFSPPQLIGLLLAFAGAAMPDESGNHYYFESDLGSRLTSHEQLLTSPGASRDTEASTPANQRPALLLTHPSK
jgi:hypothetical protein